MKKYKRKRIILAKSGLDGHDCGIQVLKDHLIENGFEVFYFGLYKNLKDITEIAICEGVDFIGLSLHNASHMKYIKEVCDYLKEKKDLGIGVVVGGIISQKDAKALKEELGVKEVFIAGTPSASLDKVTEFLDNYNGVTDSYQKFHLNQESKGGVGLSISRCVNGYDMDSNNFDAIYNPSYVVGITGRPGSGKSTLINKVVLGLRQENERVGVISIDPSHMTSGGAYLGGDRTQMREHLYDDRVVIYSMATRGFSGGIAKGEDLHRAIAIMKMYGCNIIVVETIGVGDDQGAILDCVDKTFLVLTPDVGEDQVEKTGIMQVVDGYVINKCDMSIDKKKYDGTDIKADESEHVYLYRLIKNMLSRNSFDRKIFETVAVGDRGVSDLVDYILKESGEKKK